MKKIKDVFLLIRNGASIKQINGAKGFPITRIETIANKTVDKSKFGYADIYDLEKYKDYILRDEDILMSHINSEKHLGKSALYRKCPSENIIHGMNLLVLRANKQIIEPKYARYYFNTSFFSRQLMRITKKSVNQASFTVSALKNLFIPCPKIEEQRYVVSILDKIYDLINYHQEQLNKLDLLVKSRFKGEHLWQN